MLDWLQEDLEHALVTGYSSNLVVHAFARTARECAIGPSLVTPFFESMRMDLATSSHDDGSFDHYVYGSAEVVGLMCLRVFLADSADVPYHELEDGARRLGAAFQKINFLRDLAEDHDVLGRSYFPGVAPDAFCDADRDRLLANIDDDLACAATAIPRLPAGSRRAVRAAHATFRELADRLRVTPATEIRRRRVRVPGAVKARILVGAMVGLRS
jgi:phytoene/squalene synthetase